MNDLIRKGQEFNSRRRGETQNCWFGFCSLFQPIWTVSGFTQPRTDFRSARNIFFYNLLNYQSQYYILIKFSMVVICFIKNINDIFFNAMTYRNSSWQRKKWHLEILIVIVNVVWKGCYIFVNEIFLHNNDIKNKICLTK